MGPFGSRVSGEMLLSTPCNGFCVNFLAYLDVLFYRFQLHVTDSLLTIRIPTWMDEAILSTPCNGFVDAPPLAAIALYGPFNSM